MAIIEKQDDEWEEVEPDGDMEYPNALIDCILDLVLVRSHTPEVETDLLRAVVWVFRHVKTFFFASSFNFFVDGIWV